MKSQCSRISRMDYEFGGYMNDYLRAVTEQWLLVAPAGNPAMLEIFRDRDRLPRRNMVPWAGEFAGKYLTSAVQVLRLTGDPKLRNYIREFVKELTELQAEDGYLGPWPKRNRLTGEAPNVMGQQGGTWDAWGHYHAMLGLLLWHDESRDKKALECAARIGDLFCLKFLGKKKRRLVDTGSTEMNLAVIHSLCLLYRKVGEKRYLDMALQIVEEFEVQGEEGPLAGDYLRTALAGGEFFEGPKPRWESLHPIMGLVELYWLTGREDYRTAFEQIWWSIVKLDRHNNGGFSSGEKAQGNPYHQGAIETCCTIAWMATGVEMLRLTGNSVVADELELSTLNSGLGLISHSGRWVTYNTPMDGVRKASAHDIVFQAREGSSELNCCSVNGVRGLGMVSDWALMRDGEGLALNWYGPAKMKGRLGRGVEVEVTQETEYPRKGKIGIEVKPSKAAEFALKLRIPYWSARTRVAINGERVKGVKAGTYLAIERKWKRGDRVELDLDMSFHYWKGEKECQDRASIYRGPVLLTYDRRLNEIDPKEIPTLDAKGLKGRLVEGKGWLPTVVEMEFKGEGGKKVRLCDFASAGEGGTPYVSWLKMKNVSGAPFSAGNPLRSGRG
jgi:uncharacterized protein